MKDTPVSSKEDTIKAEKQRPDPEVGQDNQKQPDPSEAKSAGPTKVHLPEAVILRHPRLGLGLTLPIGGGYFAFYPVMFRDIATVVETSDAVTVRRRGIALTADLEPVPVSAQKQED